MVEEIFNTWNDVKVPVRFGTPSDLHEAKWLKLDISKAKHKLGWAPVLPITKGLAMTAAWYQAYAQKRDMREFTLEQIRSYQTLRFKDQL